MALPTLAIAVLAVGGLAAASAVAQTTDPLWTIDANRPAIVQRIAQDHAPSLSPRQHEALTHALWQLRADRLLAASLAGSRDALDAIIAESHDALRARQKALGDATADLTYTPVNPCRIVDTRVVGGALVANVTRDFVAFSANFSTQGGTATSCNMPNGVAAVAMNVYAVNPTNLGFIKVWAANAAEPAVSTVNYQVGITAIATGAIVPVDGASNNGFKAESPAGVHFVADVVGFFRAPTNAFVNGGNVFGGSATLGTNDGYPLSIQPGSGNVGIGVGTPQSKFHVNGTSWFQGDTTPLGPGAGKGIGVGFPTGSNRGYIFAFDYATDTWQNIAMQHGGGNVGIGTLAPSAKLDVREMSFPSYAIYAENGIGTAVRGFGVVGIQGSSQTGIGVHGVGPNGLAGRFDGNVHVNGTLSKSAGTFVIDHPLDPANKTLSHSFVESSDMKNLYDGVITTDAGGVATVVLPDWFDALNRDFRYQLTVIGQFAQAIVSREIGGGTFEIRSDRPTVKVSWQVTGTRQDAYANAHRVVVEQEKTPDTKGLYHYPAGFGRPESEGVAARVGAPAQR